MNDKKSIQLQLLLYQLLDKTDDLVFTIREEKHNFFALTSGFITEIIFRYIYIDTSDTDKEDRRPIPLMKLISYAKSINIPENIVDASNTVRLYRNYEAHPAFQEKNVEDYYFACKALIVGILKWFFCEYLENKVTYDKIKRKLDFYNLTITERNLKLSDIKELNINIQNSINKLDEKFEYKLDNIETKIDKVNITVNNFIDSFNVYKKKQEINLYEILDKLIDNNKEDIEPFYQVVETALVDYQKLEQNGKSLDYLASAEYLLNNYISTEQVDFSPCVLQYCRAIEAELYYQIFIPFKQYLTNELSNNQLNKILHDADYRIDTTDYFNEFVKKKGKPKSLIFGLKDYFMLGIMYNSLSCLSVEKATRIKIYDMFKQYLNNKFDDISLLYDKKFIGKLKTLSDIRNQAAHAYGDSISKKEAIKTKNTVIKLLQSWISIMK